MTSSSINNVLCELVKCYEITPETACALNPEENEFLQTIKELLFLLATADGEIERTVTYELDVDSEIIEPSESEEKTEEEAAAVSRDEPSDTVPLSRRRYIDVYMPQQPSTSTASPITQRFSSEECQNIVEYMQKTSITSAARKFKKSPQTIRSVLKSVERGGDDMQKYGLVKQYVRHEFLNARQECSLVKKHHLYKWINEAVEKFQPKKKLQSESFFRMLKKDLGISSRRVTRFVTRKTIMEEPMVMDKARKFLEKVKTKQSSGSLEDRFFWNSDQSKFEYEMKSDRSYASIGTKIIDVRVASLKAITHSYTIQVHISKSGSVGSKLFIVFQETNGSFGPVVQKEVTQLVSKCHNVVATASKSGKLTSSLARTWFREVFAPDVDDHTCLLLDSWTGQSDNAELRSDKDISILYIPAGATKYIQPLDVYFFRQYKLLIRFIEDLCRDRFFAEDHSPRPDSRYLHIKLHSVCYRQFQHDSFRPMIRYAWQKSGYQLDEQRILFKNATELLIKPAKREKCICGASAIIFCLYCEKSLCYVCFVENLHLNCT